MIKAIFFDAVGTLFYLPKSVGYHYAFVGAEIGLTLDEQQLDRAFAATWKRGVRIHGPAGDQARP